MHKQFSFDQNGLMIKELDYFWKKPCLASVLLIDVNFKVIGVFLDREVETLEDEVFFSNSVYFEFEKCDKNARIFTHCEGKGLCYACDCEGIRIGSKK
jgi:hypothetical protein